MFSILIIAYLFLGGAAAGSFLVLSAWSLAFHRTSEQPHFRLRRAFKALQARGYAINLVALALSVVCLVWDLEYPEKALLLFSRPHATVITFGAFALAAQLVLGFLLSLANVFDISLFSGRVKKVLEALCCACSCAVMLYTGVFLAGNGAVPFWNTWWLVALFFFSALSSGISTVLLIDYFIQDQTLLLRAARPLQKVHVGCLLLEAACLAAFVAVAFTNEDASKSIALLMRPGMLSTAVVGVVGMGMAVPLLLESGSLLTKECRAIPVSDVVCLIGGFCLRYCIVMCGVH